MDKPRILWQPSEQQINETNLYKYQNYITNYTNIQFNDYHDLWQWSIDNSETFWSSLFDYFGLIYDGSLVPAKLGDEMPDVSWFSNIRLNLAENLTRYRQDDNIAIIEVSETGENTSYTWRQVINAAAAIQKQFDQWGLKPGDRVCGVLPNTFNTTAAFLAVSASGLIWSCCSPEFGLESILDRFSQIRPGALLTVDDYYYGGKNFDLKEKNSMLVQNLITVKHVLNLSKERPDDARVEQYLSDLRILENNDLRFERLPFSAPLWVLYSSGTTGVPKAITHCHGGVLLELQKYHAFHNDTRPNELFFWYSTTGWMMWNYLHGAWLMDASLLLYDGSPGYPDVDFLWKLADKYKITHFGTSAPYILANKKLGIEINKKYNLSALRSIGSTGSPLPPEGFDYVYQHIKSDVWLASMSGGTDVCTAFVGGNPMRPVYEGEIQCRTLGCPLFCLDEDGQVIHDEEGEMVIMKPMPCMPVYFWNDPEKIRYKESYFEMYPGLWRHGDWIRITPRDGVVIYGRSDATLNRQGIRIGTSEIYRSLDHIPEILDSLIIHIERRDGDHWMPLFVVLMDGVHLDDGLKNKIKHQLRNDYSPRHVPDEIIQVSGIPYTLSGKKMETPVKRLLSGRPKEKCFNVDTVRNPESLEFFVGLASRIN